MKKLFIFLVAFFIATSFAQAAADINLGDFEDGTVNSWVTWGGTVTNASNPLKNTDNNSDKVLQVVTTAQYQGVAKGGLNVNIADYQKVTLDVYDPTGAVNFIVNVYGKNASNSDVSKGFYPSTNAGAWKHYEVDLTNSTNFGTFVSITQIALQNNTVATNLLFDNIKIVAKPSTPPTKITLSAATLTPIVGKKITTSLTVEPATAGSQVTYGTSDATIATVTSAGVVTALKAGAVKIYATSTLDANVSDTLFFTISDPVVGTSMVQANFENGINPNQTQGGWNGAGTPAPTVTIVDNPNKVGNSSDKVLKVEKCNRYAAAVKTPAIDLNKYNRIKFKVYSDSAYVDFQFAMNINNSIAEKYTATGITKATWTEYEYVIDPAMAADGQFYIKMNSPKATYSRVTPPNADSLGYTFYIDSITFIAGDGSTYKPVNALTIRGANNVNTITTDNGTLQMEAVFTPEDASNKSVTWSLVNQNADTATISATGLLTAVRNATVKVKAVSVDGGFSATQDIAISNQVVPVAGITITAPDTIRAANGPAKFFASISPADADTLTYISSLVDSTGNAVTTASINAADSTITSLANGYAILKVVAAGNSTIKAEKTIIIVYQEVFVDSVKLTFDNDTTITTRKGSIELKANVYPSYATNTNVTWSVSDATIATVSNKGVVKANGTKNGSFMVYVTSNEGAKKDSIRITASNQVLFNLATFAGDLPAGATIDTIEGKKYLKVRVNGWNTTIAVEPVVTYSNSTAKFTYKYDKDTVTKTDVVQAFIQFADSGFVSKKAFTENPASTTFKTVTAKLQADTIVNLQIAAQSTANWSALKGYVVYISQMEFTNPFNMTTFEGKVPDGGEIVKINNKDYLKIRVNGWGTAFAIEPVVAKSYSTVKFSYKYDKDTVTKTDAVQAFIQLAPGDFKKNKAITDNPASTTIKELTSTLVDTTFSMLQLAAQSTANWSALKGYVVYIGKMEFFTPVLVTKIEISGESSITTAKGTTTLTAKVTPTNATTTAVKWSVDNTAIATIDAKTGVLTAVANGTVVVTATATDASGVKATFTVTITGQTSINNASIASLSVYPNPVVDVLNIRSNETISTVAIYSMSGQLNRIASVNGNSVELNLSGLKNGVYFVKIQTANGSTTQKVVKK
ncbi:MAG TPA: Ig-like domain-containing protein [Bacteroidales bacterium]|nr:Ig-like domain-containing protein [Bacteroidales bacterium]